jgi:hypothetical protein
VHGILCQVVRLPVKRFRLQIVRYWTLAPFSIPGFVARGLLDVVRDFLRKSSPMSSSPISTNYSAYNYLSYLLGNTSSTTSSLTGTSDGTDPLLKILA